MASSSSSSSSSKLATPLRPCTSNGDKSKHVTFASNHTSILIPAEFRTSPLKPRERARALRNRKATPHKKKNSKNKSSLSPPKRPGSATINRRGQKPRLVESGAVRVQISRYTNPRRGTNNHRSDRLIDQGAVRLTVTRHTTPRRLYATRSRIWSPPPSSCKKRRNAPQSEKLPDRHNSLTSTSTTTTTAADVVNTTTATTPTKQLSNAYTPSKQRSNAHRGGHRFRAVCSPHTHSSTPIISDELYKENSSADNSICLDEPERSLSRTLFD